MIVCSCNVLSDQDVRSAVEAERTRSTSQVYGCLGCSAQCGRCARTIRRLMDEALGSARAASCDGCAKSWPATWSGRSKNSGARESREKTRWPIPIRADAIAQTLF